MSDLKDQLPLAEIGELCLRFHVRELCVFGSTARGTARADSDLDLLVEFESGAKVGMLTLARLAREFAKLFGRSVDLVPKQGLNPRIRSDVLAQAEVLFAA